MILLGYLAGEPEVSEIVFLAPAHGPALGVILLLGCGCVVLHHHGILLQAFGHVTGFKTAGRTNQAPVRLAESCGLVPGLTEGRSQGATRQLAVRDASPVAQHAKLIRVQAEHH